MSKKCFLICPIGDEGSDIRRHSDDVHTGLIDPVCDKFDIDVIRSDLEKTANHIDDDMFNHLGNDDLAIADFTGLNPNVFYEAGYRYAKGLPIIHIAEKKLRYPLMLQLFEQFSIRFISRM